MNEQKRNSDTQICGNEEDNDNHTNKKKKIDCRDKQMIDLQVSFFEKSFSMQVLNDCYDSSYDANGSLLLTCKNCDAQLRGDAKCHIVSAYLFV